MVFQTLPKTFCALGYQNMRKMLNGNAERLQVTSKVCVTHCLFPKSTWKLNFSDVTLLFASN